MVTAEQFIAEIDAYLDREKVSASAFGREAIGDPNLVGDLRAGRMPNLRTLARVTEFMQASSVAAQPERERTA